MPYQVYHNLPGSDRGQSPAKCGKTSVQLWQSERYTQAYFTLENESTVQYEYGSFDLNNPEHYNDDKKCDGQITIHKDLLSKLSDSAQLIKDRVIEIVNCSNYRSKTCDEFEKTLLH